METHLTQLFNYGQALWRKYGIQYHITINMNGSGSISWSSSENKKNVEYYYIEFSTPQEGLRKLKERNAAE